MRHLRPLCAHCIYWNEDHSANPPTAGHCHRYPPGIYINPETGTVVQKFPTTDHHHWCGEWSADDNRFTLAVHRAIAEKAGAPASLAE